MSLLAACFLLLPLIYATVVVRVHQLAVYNPISSCAFLRNVSLPPDASVQSCIWECFHESQCQTAVYFSQEKVCSLFIESCQSESIHSSGNIRAHVICYPKYEGSSIHCPSTVATSLAPMSTKQMTTTTTRTTTATANPCGTPVPIGSSGTIYSTTTSSSSYSCHYVAWIANTTGNVTLAFQLQNLPGVWYVDDVSVSNGTTELLLNGGFESGDLLPGWTRTTPNGNCGSGTIGGVRSSSCRTGNYCLTDGCDYSADQISQSFSVTTGRVYYISFWIKQQGGSGTGIFASVTLS